MDAETLARVFKWMAIMMVVGLVLIAGLMLFIVSIAWSYM